MDGLLLSVTPSPVSISLSIFCDFGAVVVVVEFKVLVAIHLLAEQ